MQSTSNTLLSTEAVGLALTFGLGLVTLLLTWVKEWNQSARRIRAINEASERIKFARAWLESQTLLAGSGKHSIETQSHFRSEIDAARDTVRLAYVRWPIVPLSWSAAEYAAYLALLAQWRRMLLIHRLRYNSLVAQCFRALYVVYFVLLFISVNVISFRFLSVAEKRGWIEAVRYFRSSPRFEHLWLLPVLLMVAALARYLALNGGWSRPRTDD